MIQSKYIVKKGEWIEQIEWLFCLVFTDSLNRSKRMAKCGECIISLIFFLVSEPVYFQIIVSNKYSLFLLD